MKPGSKGWKKFMSKLYGFGAAIVIVGALFKIQHWNFFFPFQAGVLLTVGLLTESIIFIFSAFEPIHEDPNWELVYPELALGHADDLDHATLPSSSRASKGSGITDQFDKMLEEAKIDAQLLERLGDGMRALGDNAAQLKGVTSAAAAADSYAETLQQASQKVSQLSDAYERASVSVMGLTAEAEEGQSFGEQMNKVSKNLSALNNVYELQLRGASSHLEATEKFHSQVTEMMENLSASAQDTKLYRENMAMLSKNLTDLNSVYGNMLKAMTITRD
jgi:gliding motility-associated protein GldL